MIKLAYKLQSGNCLHNSRDWETLEKKPTRFL